MSSAEQSLQVISAQAAINSTPGSDPPLLWDVRSGGEWAALHSPLARHVPLPLIVDHAADLARLNLGPIAVFCATG
ncbi:MAG: hypothetical protein ACRC0L_05750, partial [Angustibacter sp.]